MDDDQTVTMSRMEWQQIVAIVANATGWPTVNKFFQQLQLQQAPTYARPNGLEPEVEAVQNERQVPRRYPQ